MNKIPLLISLFLLGFQCIFGQEIVLKNIDSENIYALVGNYIEIVGEHENCENIILKIDKGYIEKRREFGCQYVFYAHKVGRTKLTIYEVRGKDTIQVKEQIYKVKKWTQHQPYIGSISSEGEMSKAEFWAHGGVNVPIQYFDMTGRIPVVSYKIAVARDGERIFELENIGGRFEENNYGILKSVRAGDTVFISEIMVQMPGESISTKLSNLRIEIVK